MTKRQQQREQILDLVKDNRPNTIPQHLLISGKEGTGKSYLIEEFDSKLTACGHRIVKFLYPHCYIVTADNIINKVEASSDQSTIILIDDFDKMLQFLPHDEQFRLRAFLFKKNAPMLIATSTGLYEGFSDYRAPFYDAFRIFHLPSLEKEDYADILPMEVYDWVKGNEDFLSMAAKFGNNTNYIRSLAMAIHCGQNTNEAIQTIINENSRYFRLLFDNLSGVLQRALFGLAHSGEVAQSAEVQHQSGLSAANTASALFRLEKQGVITRIGEKKRNVSYSIKDCILRRWLTQ